MAERPHNWNTPTVMFAAMTCAVCLAVAATLWPSLSAKAYCYDDNFYLSDNILVRHPSPEAARRFLTEVTHPSTVSGYYQPLAMISLMLDSAAGGTPINLVPFHRTSLLLHVCNTALIAALLYLLFGRAWPACLAALLFGLHPLVVEPIAWIGERKTVLAAFFSLASLVSYVVYAKKGSRGGYGLAILLYVLALMSKPTSTPLPAAMLLLDFWPLGRLGRRAILEKIPFLAIGVISACITVVSQANTAAVATPGEYGPMRAVLVVGYDIIFYLQKMVLPMDLTSHYAFPSNMTISNPVLLGYLAASIILIIVLAISLKWTRSLLTGWLIFFLMTLPTMQVLQFSNVIASDKYAYLPAAGVLIVLGWAIGRAWDATGRRGRAWIAAGLLLAAGAEAYGTRHQLAYWQDTVSLFDHMTEVTPKAVSPRNNLAIALAKRGELAKAMEQLQICANLDPESPQVMDGMGTLLMDMGRPQEALLWYLKALEILPKAPGVHYNAGATLMKLGRAAEALPHLELAVKTKPEWPIAQDLLGRAYAQVGRSGEAEDAFKKALRLEPSLRKAWVDLADLYVERKRWNDAAEAYRKALELQADYDTLNNLAGSLVEAGKPDQAEGYYRRAIALKPEAAMSYCNLAVVLAKGGRMDEAAQLLRKALQVEPGNQQARRYLEAINSGR